MEVFRIFILYIISFVICSVVSSGVASLTQQVFRIWGDTSVCSKISRSELVVFTPQESPSGISVIICPSGNCRYLFKKIEEAEVTHILHDEPGLRFKINPKKEKGTVEAPLWTQPFIPCLEEIRDIRFTTKRGTK